MRAFFFVKKVSLGVVLAALLMSASAARAAGESPTLWLVTIGVSDYERPIYVNNKGETKDMRDAVQFAAKDARDVGDALQAQEGKLFGRVVRKTLTNAEATKANIESTLQWLRQQPIQQGDYVVVFGASHGGAVNGQYYFVPYDVNVQAPPESSEVSAATMVAALAGLPGTRLLILDTCDAACAAQGTGAREAGIITLAGCLSRQGSKENHRLQNGRLSGALVEGLRGAADFNGDGVITLSELYAYVCNRVAAFDAENPAAVAQYGPQTPTMDQPSHVPGNLPLARLAGAAAGIGTGAPAGNGTSGGTLPPVTLPPASSNAVAPPVITGPIR